MIALPIVATPIGAFGIGPAMPMHEGSTPIAIANPLRLPGYNGPTGNARATDRATPERRTLRYGAVRAR